MSELNNRIKYPLTDLEQRPVDREQLRTDPHVVLATQFLLEIVESVCESVDGFDDERQLGILLVAVTQPFCACDKTSSS